MKSMKLAIIFIVVISFCVNSTRIPGITWLKGKRKERQSQEVPGDYTQYSDTPHDRQDQREIQLQDLPSGRKLKATWAQGKEDSPQDPYELPAGSNFKATWASQAYKTKQNPEGATDQDLLANSQLNWAQKARLARNNFDKGKSNAAQGPSQYLLDDQQQGHLPLHDMKPHQKARVVKETSRRQSRVGKQQSLDDQDDDADWGSLSFYEQQDKLKTVSPFSKVPSDAIGAFGIRDSRQTVHLNKPLAWEDTAKTERAIRQTTAIKIPSVRKQNHQRLQKLYQFPQYSENGQVQFPSLYETGESTLVE